MSFCGKVIWAYKAFDVCKLAQAKPAEIYWPMFTCLIPIFPLKGARINFLEINERALSIFARSCLTLDEESSTDDCDAAPWENNCLIRFLSFQQLMDFLQSPEAPARFLVVFGLLVTLLVGVITWQRIRIRKLVRHLREGDWLTSALLNKTYSYLVCKNGFRAMAKITLKVNIILQL